jgi:hypothetical protein
MTKTLKSFAIAMLVTGATVTATRAPAAVNTNTFTNVIQTVSFTLTAYSNAVPASSGKTTVAVKPVAITSKSIVAALSNDAAFIPALSNFNFGKTPQLVLNTVFALSNTTVINSTNVGAVFTNSIGTNDNGFLYFTVAATNGTNVITITNASSSLTISNNAIGTNGGTNVITDLSGATETTNFVLTNLVTFTNATGLTNATFPTNAGVWTVISTSTNSSGTNINITTYTNVATVTGAFVTNSSGIEIQGGTATAPTFADVSSLLATATGQESVTAETGTALGTSNAVATSKTTSAYGTYTVSVFNPNSTAAGNNIVLSLDGLVKAVKKIDVLHQSKAGTNEVTDTTSTATVAGFGSIGGIYSTNTNVVSGLSIAIPSTNELSGTNALTTGTITNIIPVVVTGTVVVGSPKSVAQ